MLLRPRSLLLRPRTLLLNSRAMLLNSRAMLLNSRALLLNSRATRLISTASNPASPASIAVGTLRAVITVLVVVHHALLAYNPFAPPPPATLTAQPRFWGAFPVVDSHRWGTGALLTSFNDMFFMALMF